MSRVFVPRVFVLGNASIDTTLRVPRLPLPGETLMATGIQRSPGGKGLNQAIMAARAGAEVHFLAPIGPDSALLREAVAAERITASWAETAPHTDLSTLLVAPDGENCIISTGTACDSLDTPTALAFIAQMRPVDLLLIQGNLPLPLTLAAARAAIHAQGGRIMLNTAPLRWDYTALLPLCTLVVANRHEAASLPALPSTAITTLGPEGCRLGHRHFPAPAVTAIDTTGAGDVFCGVLAAHYARGTPLDDAIPRAQEAAALSVTRAGCYPSFPARHEIK